VINADVFFTKCVDIISVESLIEIDLTDEVIRMVDL